MGNSGSGLHNITVQNERQSKHANFSAPELHLNSSIVIPSSLHLHDQQHHVKVLPTLSLDDPPRLRSTNNGMILLGGGTISCRKENDGVQRSHSISSIKYGSNSDLLGETSGITDKVRHGMEMLRQRSQTQICFTNNCTQLDTKVNKFIRHEQVDYELHGEQRRSNELKRPESSNDVVDQSGKSIDDITTVQRKEHLQNNNLRSKFGNERNILVKRKGAAPLPPVTTHSPSSPLNMDEPHPDAINPSAASPEQQSDAVEIKENNPEELVPSPPTRRRSRFFKTNAETLATTSKLNIFSPFQRQFRREKSFDVSLMQRHHTPKNSESTLGNNPVQLKRGIAVKINHKEYDKQCARVKQQQQEHRKKLQQQLRQHKVQPVEPNYPAPTLKIPANPSAATMQIPLPNQRQKLKKNLMDSMVSTASMTPAPAQIIPTSSTTTTLVTPIEPATVTSTSVTPVTVPVTPLISDLNEPDVPAINSFDDEEKLKTKTFYFGMKDDRSRMVLPELKFKIAGANEDVSDNGNSIVESIVQPVVQHEIERNCDIYNPDFMDQDDENYYFIEDRNLIVRRLTSTMNNLSNDTNNDIQLNLRPTLPRRQFEIPRFSPVAAWRTLTTHNGKCNNDTDGVEHLDVAIERVGDITEMDPEVIQLPTASTIKHQHRKQQLEHYAQHHQYRSIGESQLSKKLQGSSTSSSLSLQQQQQPPPPPPPPPPPEESSSLSPPVPTSPSSSLLPTAPPFIEQRIERLYREPIILPGFHNDNKSGDSGISGDAGLLPLIVDGVEQIGSPKTTTVTTQTSQTSDQEKHQNSPRIVGPFLKPWTPRQDLESSSSNEETEDVVDDIVHDDNPDKSLDECLKIDYRLKQQQQQQHVGHIFSLSLPRESTHANNGSVFTTNIVGPTAFNSLRKIKKTMSGVFCNTDNVTANVRHHHHHHQHHQHHQPHPLLSYRSNDNWLLSRSAPNSIENFQQFSTLNVSDRTIVDDQRKIDPGIAFDQQQKSDLKHLASGKHIMYLPKHSDRLSNDYRTLGFRHSIETSAEQKKKPNQDDRVTELHDTNGNPALFREPMTDETIATGLSKNIEGNNVKNGKSSHLHQHHRYKFQSTIRQIERRRIADILSREAEQQEIQRLSEMEAMKRVEEEFQRKRASEKASIRHQLRLYSMNNAAAVTSASTNVDMSTETTSYGPDEQLNPIMQHNHHFASLPVAHSKISLQREEPEGAVSSPAMSPTFSASTKPQYYRQVNRGFSSMDTPIVPAISRTINQKPAYASKSLEQKSSKNYSKSNNRMKYK